MISVKLEKTYAHRDTDEIKTIYGTIEIEASTEHDAHQIVSELMSWENQLQSNDPRIYWDYEDLPYDEELNFVPDWVYQDWSFQVTT